jgi:PEP-CTERM motif
MRIHRLLIISLVLALAATAAKAESLVYIINGSQQFGTIDLTTGAFQQIGPLQPEIGSFGLATAPDGSLVTFSYSSNLYSIKPTTGVPTLVGPTGLDDCATPASPCGPTSGSTLGNYAGSIYATDFANSLYKIDPVTGLATLIGATGIPGVPFVPGSLNPDGTINFYDESIFSSDTSLYATFDAFIFDLNTFSVVSTIIAPQLYQINALTGAATVVGPTDLSIGAVTRVNGTYYAFNENIGAITTLDLATGNTSFVTNFDPAAGVVQGAVPIPSPVPEPSSLTLIGTGILGLVTVTRRKLRSMPRVPHP